MERERRRAAAWRLIDAIPYQDLIETERWSVRSVESMDALFDYHPSFEMFVPRASSYRFLKRDFSQAPGVAHLRYTNPVAVAEVDLRKERSSHVLWVSLYVQCHEGRLNQEEAMLTMGELSMPRPNEIQREAARIRIENDAAGVIRYDDWFVSAAARAGHTRSHAE
jgi:hypothetical protein